MVAVPLMDRASGGVPSAARHQARLCRGGQPWSAAPAPLHRAPQHRRHGLRVVAKGAAAPPPATKPPPAAASSSARAAVTGAWPCKGGALVKVLQQAGETHRVQVVLEGGDIPKGATVELHWGVYRSAPHLWQHPPEVVPPGSERDDRSGAMVTPMKAAAGGATHSLTLSVPAGLAPLTLAFVVRVVPPEGEQRGGRPARASFVTPLRGRHFSALIGCGSGSSAAQGVALVAPAPAAAAGGSGGGPGAAQAHTVNFAVRCRGADRVCLVLLRPGAAAGKEGEWGMMELVLDPVLNRTGELWHISVEGLRDLDGLCYGWRLEGDVSWESGCRVQPDLLLVDPYCPTLRYFPAGEAADRSPLPLPTLTLADGATVAVASSLEGLAAEARRQQALAASGGVVRGEALVPGPDHALEQLCLMELDVRTFAQGMGVQHPGSYLGVAERVAHIKAVGANAVILTPSYATAKGIGVLARSAVHFMAADPQLASGGGAGSSSLRAAAEFRQMVSLLHAQGIEVLLEVDLTFTAEGTDQHPSSVSLRGLSYGSYYRSNGVLNCGDAAAREYILAVLHHWAREGVDGFCFINAENMVQDRTGFVLDAPPLADAICHDPLLTRLKLVAHPSNESLLPREGRRGFPHWGLWQQRNTGFGRDVLAFLAEDTPGLLTAVAGRLTGSANIFDADWDPAAALPGNLAIGRRPAFGVNSVTVLGRQNLVELAAEAAELAAAAARAEAAGGYAPQAAGPPAAATISKSLLALMVLALGVPIIPQDAVVDLPSAHFVGVLVRMRRRLAALLLPPRFDSPRDIRWHSAPEPSVQPVWDAEVAAGAAASGAKDTNYLAFSVRSVDGQAVYVGINPYPHSITAVLPTPPAGRVWERIVDTSLQPPEDAYLEGGAPVRARSIPVAPKAVVVLQSAVLETANLQGAAPQLLRQ